MADTITVTSGTAGQVGSTAAELITYMSATMLKFGIAKFDYIR